MIKKYRCQVLKIDYAVAAAGLLGMFIVILIGINTYGTMHLGWMVLLLLFYIMQLVFISRIGKCFTSKWLRQAHFVLSVVCRAENNRYYLKRGVEVRPGYLARWVEF